MNSRMNFAPGCVSGRKNGKKRMVVYCISAAAVCVSFLCFSVSSFYRLKKFRSLSAAFSGGCVVAERDADVLKKEFERLSELCGFWNRYGKKVEDERFIFVFSVEVCRASEGKLVERVVCSPSVCSADVYFPHLAAADVLCRRLERNFPSGTVSVTVTGLSGRYDGPGTVRIEMRRRSG